MLTFGKLQVGKNNCVIFQARTAIRKLSTVVNSPKQNMNITKRYFDEFNCCCNLNRNHFEVDGSLHFMEILRIVIAVPTSVAATIANLLVLVSILRTPALRTPSNVLLASLALTDFGVGLFTLLFTSMWFCSVSLFTLTAVSLDRLIALKTHLRYEELVTVKRAFVSMGVTWLVGLAYGALCLWDFSTAVYFSAAGIPLCFVISTIAYCAIYRVVRRHQIQVDGQLQAQNQEGAGSPSIHYKRSFFSMFLIYFVFLFCYTPYLILSTIIVTTDATLAVYSATEMSLSLVHCNSVLNPIIYCWRFENIRQSVKKTTRAIFRRNPPASIG